MIVYIAPIAAKTEGGRMNLKDDIDRLEKDVADLEFQLEQANADFHQASLTRKKARKDINNLVDEISDKLAEVDGLWALENDNG